VSRRAGGRCAAGPRPSTKRAGTFLGGHAGDLQEQLDGRGPSGNACQGRCAAREAGLRQPKSGIRTGQCSGSKREIEQLLAARYPRPEQPDALRKRHIPAEVKRAVLQRDGARCAFIDAQGRRCSETGGLQFHHVDPYGRGGPHTAENVRLVCAAHNRYLAEREYGAAVIAQHISTSAALAGNLVPSNPGTGSRCGPGAAVPKRTGQGP
jgi:hypothetical protein